eukprot:6987819-Pyramimonas_sp.AAC.1
MGSLSPRPPEAPAPPRRRAGRRRPAAARGPCPHECLTMPRLHVLPEADRVLPSPPRHGDQVNQVPQHTLIFGGFGGA